MQKRVLLFFFWMVLSQMAMATHNRSGEITYRQTGPLTIEATITTYTKASSSGVDRDSLDLNWGDGTMSKVGRTNGEGQLIAGLDVKVNYYTAEHTYPGRATYTIFFTDPNRVDNIQNLNFPNSVDIKFYIQTTLTLFDTQFNGLNNSAILLQPPLDFGCVNAKFKHNPNAYDADGDSLAYELVIPLQGVDTIVPNYMYPDEVLPGPLNAITFDETTGDFVWDSPKLAGEYNIAIKIKEYRNGNLINSIIRDMQILITLCENLPPEITALDTYCVIAGEELKIPIQVDDPEEDQLVNLMVTGGIFEDSTNVIFWDNSGTFQPTEFEETLTWLTNCNDVQKEPYQLVFRAQDNGLVNGGGLTDLKTIQIYVVAPPPLDLQAEVVDSGFDLSWESPYTCENAAESFFRGFTVWRKIGSNPFQVDTCDTGLQGKGYQAISNLTNALDQGRYIYHDENIETGVIYCYRVLANFALQTEANNPLLYNISESIPSNEVCATSNRKVPLLTAVDVRTTDENSGEIFISWLKPIPDELDTMENPGPYVYQLERSEDGLNYMEVPGASFTSPFFSSSVDTNFIDTNLNTLKKSYFYQVNFNSDGKNIGSSPPSESVYLNLISSDSKNILSWNPNTSWQNYNYRIFRYDEDNNQFNLLETTSRPSYEDKGLENGEEYCYKVQTIGTYGLANTPLIIENFSQEICGIPLDTLGPCAPTLAVTNACAESNLLPSEWNLINLLSWNNVSIPCEDSQDLAGYNIYYAYTMEEAFELLETIDDPENINTEHSPLEGTNACYKITAFDELGNESEFSATVCISNCPQYELPNTFTPNGDGANDIFFPRSNRFIDAIRFELFNEWGNKVYETTDPNINWDGRDLGGREVDDGVYYYTCTLLEEISEGTFQQKSLINGFIQVIR